MKGTFFNTNGLETHSFLITLTLFWNTLHTQRRQYLNLRPTKRVFPLC